MSLVITIVTTHVVQRINLLQLKPGLIHFLHELLHHVKCTLLSLQTHKHVCCMKTRASEQNILEFNGF